MELSALMVETFPLVASDRAHGDAIWQDKCHHSYHLSSLEVVKVSVSDCILSVTAFCKEYSGLYVLILKTSLFYCMTL